MVADKIGRIRKENDMSNEFKKLNAAIDPLALLLPPSLYAKLVEKFHPHVPSVAEIAEILRVASPAERTEMASRIASVSTCTKLVKEASAKVM